MNRLIRYLGIWVLMLGVASCISPYKGHKSPKIGELSGKAYMEKVIELSPSWQTLSAKVACDLKIGDGKSAKVNASLRLKRGELIRVSVVPLLGIEVARLDVSPSGLLLIDRVHKRYVQVSFEEIRERWKIDFNFNILQSMLLNEIFFPGNTVLEPKDAKLFFVNTFGEEAVLEAKTGKRLLYHFHTSVKDASLQETRIGAAGTPYELSWKYNDFKVLSGRNYPTYMSVNLAGGSKPLALDMHFSRLSTGGEWDTTSEVSSRYKKITIQELLKMLIK